MKNKKPKTIKEIVQSYDISEDWEGMYREIKQLIADEVVDLDTEFTLYRYNYGDEYFYKERDVFKLAKNHTKQQRKKLESL